VVIAISCAEPVSYEAMAAAVQVAVAFNAEIEANFIEDRQLADAGAFPFACEVPMRGAPVAPFELEPALERMRAASRRVRAELQSLAAAADVPVRYRHLRTTPLRALSEACQEVGPWNVVAQCRPMSLLALRKAIDVLEHVTGMTGVVVGGDCSRVAPRREGALRPVVAVIEDFERLAGMRRTAERLARVSGAEVCLALAAKRRSQLNWLENEVRSNLAPSDTHVDVVRLGSPGGGSDVIAEALRRLDPGFLIAAHGGLTLPAEGDLAPLVGILRCPLLLVR